MKRDVIKLLIAENQKSIAEIRLIERSYKLEDNLNYVFVGLRRAGKSYLMFQQIGRLLADGHKIDEILYFNFEDDRLNSLTISDLDLIKQCHEEMYDTKPVFFLDEIQIVEGWEKFARRLADQNYRVYITGSNAKMLSNEIATTLGGRFMIHEVFPYSLEEYLMAMGIDMGKKNEIYERKNDINRAFDSYFYFGGLPETVNVVNKREWLGNLYQKLFFGDLIARYQIRNEFALRVLIRKLAESIKQPSSFTRLANVVSASGKKVSTDTVIDYLSYLKDSWLIFSIENFAAKLTGRETNKKYYFIDNGILNLFLSDPLTSLLENSVAIHLRKRYGQEVYFYLDGVKVDFCIPEEQLAVQVCYSLTELETSKREVNALLKLSQRIKLTRMMIITKDEEGTITENGVQIDVVPVRKWLMQM